MINIIKMEIYNFRRLWFCKLILLFPALFSGIYTINEMSSFSKMANLGYPFPLANGFYFFTYIVSNHKFAVPFILICAVLSAFYIGSDFMNRTITRQIAVGHSRLKLLSAKILVYFTAIAIMILSAFLTSSIIGISAYGIGESFSIGEVAYIIRYLLLAIVLYIGTCSLFVFMTFTIQDIAKSLVCSVGAFLFLYFATDVLHVVTKINIFGFLPIWFVSDITNKNMTGSEIAVSATSALCSIILLVSVTYFVNRKRELK